MIMTYDDIKKFNQLAKQRGNLYETVNYLSKKARKYCNETHCLESEALTYVTIGKTPKIHKNDIPEECSKLESVLSLVSNEDIIQSVLRSVELSTPEHIQYVYLDSLDEYEMSRVRILVNKILMK